MIDVSQGKTRVRKWPRKRGKPKTKADKKRQDDFRQVQALTHYVAPGMYAQLVAATKQTALYPRDILTSMMFGRLCSFQLPDGRIVSSMAARQDTSRSLDTITQTQGAYLRRGPDGWEEATPPSGGAGTWQLLADEMVTGAAYESPDWSEHSTLIIIGIGISTTSNVTRGVQLRDKATGNYYATTGDYQYGNSTGGGSDANAIYAHSGITVSPRYFVIRITGNGHGIPLLWEIPNRSMTGYMPNLTAPTAGFRLAGLSGGAVTGLLSGGRIVVIGA